MVREAEERRNLAVIISYAMHQPKDLDKVTPKPKAPESTPKQEFEAEDWWDASG